MSRKLTRSCTSSPSALIYVMRDEHGWDAVLSATWSSPDGWCRRQRLYFNLNPTYSAFFADRGSRDYMACHELGHTIGLHHWGNPPISDGPARPTCMQADVPNGPTDLHRWDIEDINMYYPSPPTP